MNTTLIFIIVAAVVVLVVVGLAKKVMKLVGCALVIGLIAAAAWYFLR